MLRAGLLALLVAVVSAAAVDWQIDTAVEPEHVRTGAVARLTVTVKGEVTARPTVEFDETAWPDGVTPGAGRQIEEFVGREYHCRRVWDLRTARPGVFVLPAFVARITPPGTSLTLVRSGQPTTLLVTNELPDAVPVESDHINGGLLAGLGLCLCLAALAVLAWLRRSSAPQPLPGQELAPVDPQSPAGRLLASVRQAAARRNQTTSASYLAELAKAAHTYASERTGQELLTTADVREHAGEGEWQSAVLALLEATDQARFARTAVDDAAIGELLEGLERAVRE